MRWIAYRTEFGVGWVGFDDQGVGRILLPGSTAPSPSGGDVPAGVLDLAAGLERYFAGAGALPPADARLLRRASTTEWRRAVYRIVCAIPSGRTLTYAEVAELTWRPRAARAVGAAMAANPYAPVIPCHRVVASDGGLAGYAGGVEMKRWLLALESGHA